MAKHKYIESPEKLWEYFQSYKADIKSRPFKVKDWVGKDGDQVMREKGVINEEPGKAYVTPELSNALVSQVKGLVKAGRYQLKYFPAIVIDGRYVIYGTTDINEFERLKP